MHGFIIRLMARYTTAMAGQLQVVETRNRIGHQLLTIIAKVNWRC